MLEGTRRRRSSTLNKPLYGLSVPGSNPTLSAIYAQKSAKNWLGSRIDPRTRPRDASAGALFRVQFLNHWESLRRATLVYAYA